ncbi:MAG: MmgE/PrpD family protein [Candidatus Methanofastidiosia archaeon]
MIEATREFAKFVTELKYDDLPERVIKSTKEQIMSACAAILSGSRVEPIKQLENTLKKWGGSQLSTVIPYGWKTTPFVASMIYGNMPLSIELGDTPFPYATHPPGPTICPAIALTEAQEKSGKDLITAVAAGVEIGVRTQQLIPGVVNMWITRGDVMSSTTVASKLLNLNLKQTISSFGTACMLGPIWIARSFFYGTAKNLYEGASAAMGILAAELAQNGITSAHDVLEGPGGVWDMLSNSYPPKNIEGIISNLGKDWKIDNMTIKTYACCHIYQSAIDATTKCVKQNDININNISKIEIYMPFKFDHINSFTKEDYLKKEDVTFVNFQFVGWYPVVVSLLYGECQFEQFLPQILTDNRVWELGKKIQIKFDPELTKGEFLPVPARAVITDKLSNTYECSVVYPRGHKRNPYPVSKKFKRSAKTCNLPDSKISALLEIFDSLEEQQSIDTMINLLCNK